MTDVLWQHRLSNMDSDSEDIERDFKKNFRNIETIGYRDGVMHGKEDFSQEKFDSGYAEGLRLGLTVEYHREMLRLINSDESFSDFKDVLKLSECDKSLQIEENGNCLVCEGSKSENIPKNAEIEQKSANDKVIDDINRKYSAVVNKTQI